MGVQGTDVKNGPCLGLEAFCSNTTSVSSSRCFGKLSVQFLRSPILGIEEVYRLKMY